MAGARQHVLITVIGQRRAPYRLLEVNGFAGMEEPFQAFFASIPYE